MSSNIRELIRNAVREVLAEMTATGNIAGFETPFAFTGGKAAGEKKRKEAAVNSTGFMLVDDFEDDEDTADSRSVEERDKPLTDPIENRKKNIKVGNRKSLEEALSTSEQESKLAQIMAGVKNGTISPRKAALAIRKIVADQGRAFNASSMDEGRSAAELDKVWDGILTGVSKGIITKELAKKLLTKLDAERTEPVDTPIQHESINEGKYHQWRNDPTLSPRQKIGRSIREVNELLGRIEESVTMNQRLKEEAGVRTSDYWKRTNSALLKIENKLLRITNKIKQVR